jgi:hypothetical protein
MDSAVIRIEIFGRRGFADDERLTAHVFTGLNAPAPVSVSTILAPLKSVLDLRSLLDEYNDSAIFGSA